MNTNVVIILPSTAIRDREWWAVESRRVGSDWASLGSVVARVMYQLQLTSPAAWGSS